MNYLSPIIALLVTVLLMAYILASKFARKIQDVPNSRSLHNAPIPRVGGVAIMAGVFSAWGLMLNSLAWWIVLPLTGLFVVSLLDDVLSLPVSKRLSAQVAAAVILVSGSGLLSQQGVLIALAMLLATVWMTNLYNFMDGSDGLAGGMALFGFAFYGIAALIAHDVTLAMMNFSISAAALGFLFFNFHPAKAFMGDSGSITLGFLAAAMGLWGWQQGCWAAWFPLVIFLPFIADASVTLVKRTLRGVKITEAHREHYYQHAIQLGWGHRNVALAEYALMLGSGLTALATLEKTFPWQAILANLAIYAVLMLLLDMAWKKFERRQHA